MLDTSIDLVSEGSESDDDFSINDRIENEETDEGTYSGGYMRYRN
jgi:hypothetical protein